MKHITITTVIMILLLSVLTGCNGADSQTEHSSESQSETVDEVIEVTRSPEQVLEGGIRKIYHSYEKDGKYLITPYGAKIPYYDEVVMGVITMEDAEDLQIDKKFMEYRRPEGCQDHIGLSINYGYGNSIAAPENVSDKKYVIQDLGFLGDTPHEYDVMYYYFALYEHYPEDYSPVRFMLYGLPADAAKDENGKITKESIKNTYSYETGAWSDDYVLLADTMITKTGGLYVDTADLYQGKDYVNLLRVCEFEGPTDSYNYVLGGYAYDIMKRDEYDAWKQKNKEAYLSVGN